MARRKPGRENLTPGFAPTPPKPVASAPDAPSAQKLADKAKELKARPKGVKKPPKQSQEEITNEIKVAEHFALAEEMAKDTVDIIDVGMSHVDDMYEQERAWVLKHKHEKWSFTFNTSEQQTVGNACFTLYRKVDPARLAAWGGFMTAAALIATVLLPRMKMANELSQLRKDLDDAERKRTQVKAPAPAVSDSRAPGKQAPAPAVAGVPIQGADGQTRYVNPTDKAGD